MTSESAFGSAEQEPLPWWLALIDGIALLIVGLLFLSSPGKTSVIVVQVLGLYWIFTGILSIVRMFIDRSNWGWKLFAGIVGILAGILILNHPLWSTAIVGNTAIYILGFGGIFIGIMNIVQAFRGAGWAAGVLGVVSFLLGVALLANHWIFTFSLPWTLGVLSVIGGILIIFGAFRSRSEAKKAEAQASAPEPPEVEAPGAVRSGAAVAVATEAVEEVAEEAEEVAEEAPVVAEEAPVLTEEAPEVAAEAPVVASEAVEVAEEAVEDTGILDEKADKAKFHQPLTYIEGIGPAYSSALSGIGINSPQELLEKGAARAGRLDIAEKSQISIKLITRWVNQVDLYRIPGIGPQYGDLLERSGVNTVPELAQRNPKNLHDKLMEVNTEKNLVREVAGLPQVESWIEQAKGMPAKITF